MTDDSYTKGYEAHEAGELYFGHPEYDNMDWRAGWLDGRAAHLSVSKNDGGPAFPNQGLIDVTGVIQDQAPGMSLREYASVSAMHGLLASGPHDCDQHGIAHDAVEQADALLAALAEKVTA